MARFRGRDIELKTTGELTAMRAAGALVAKTLAAVADRAKPGVSTGELDVLAEHTIREAGGVPSFLGYHGFPASICASINDEVVHGIPSPRPVLADGDLITIDCGAILDGWHGDAAVTLEVGAVTEPDRALSAACRSALDAGVAAARPSGGSPTSPTPYRPRCEAAAARDGVATRSSPTTAGTASAARCTWTRTCRTRAGRAAARGCTRDGAGDRADADRGRQRDPGAGGRLDGGHRGRLAAVHWEHTVAITEDGPWVLTAPGRRVLSLSLGRCTRWVRFPS